MPYSETRIVINGLADIPILVFMANFIKGGFGIKTEEEKVNVVKEEPVKIIEVKDTLIKEEKAEAIKNSTTSLTVLKKGWWGLWDCKEEKERKE